MMNLNDNAKRWAVVAGCGLFCAALVALIGARFIPQAPADGPPPSSSEEAREVNPNIERPEIQEEKMVVSIPEPQPEEVGEASAPAVSGGTEQTIQPDPVIPSEPEKPVAQGDHTNPHQQPAYQPEDIVKPSQPSVPQNGDTSGGKIYVDGFGWIENHGGGGSGATVGNQGDQLTGNKVGQM